MDAVTLQQIIANGETSQVEFKLKPPRPAELAERMCGMANTSTGGLIIFGIRDATHDLVGVNRPNEATDLILRASRTAHPTIPLVHDGPVTVIVDGRTLLVVTIPPNSGQLYQASGVFWYRRGSHTVPLTISEITAHLHQSGSLQWETTLCRLARITDLDERQVDHYLSLRTAQSRLNLRHTPRDDLLIGLRCCGIDPQTGKMHPTNVGILMFGIDPQWHLPQTEIVCAHYNDDLGIETFTDRQILRGTATELIDGAARYLMMAMNVSATIVGFTRVDKPEYPLEALREAVVNAVVHRDYSLTSEAIRIFIYSDRIEIHSPGLLPSGISLSSVRALQAPSRPRNPVLAQFLRDVPGYAERIGVGIRLMVNEMQLLGLPEPDFIEQHEFLVTFRNGQFRTDDHVTSLNARQLLGLRLVQQRGSIASSDYCRATGVSDRTALRELRDMVDRGILSVRGKTRSARYYLP